MSDKNELTVKYEVDGNEIKLTPSIVQNYIVGEDNGKITISEFKFFTELCKARKLNPFLREAYCIKYGNQPAALVVGKDAVLKRAIRHPQYNGRENGVIVQTEDGEVVERKGAFKLDEEKLVGGWAKVYRKDWEFPTYVSVSLSEAIQTKKDGEANSNWKNKPATMIEKVAVVRALRETFIEELGGMYEAEEMNVELPHDTVPEQAEMIVEQTEPIEGEYTEISMDELK